MEIAVLVIFMCIVSAGLTASLMRSRVRTAEHIAAHAVMTTEQEHEALRKALEDLTRERNLNARAKSFMEIIAKAAVRDEETRRWVVSDDVLDAVDRFMEVRRVLDETEK